MFTERVAGVLGGPVSRRVRRRGLFGVACLLAGLAVGSAGAAESPDVADRQAIEAVIRAQIDALGRDDAERAFGFASPGIRRRFGSADAFLAMVRDNYDPVYRPARVRFVRLVATGARRVQTVDVTDETGRVWRALFTMERQRDRSWKVDGCRLVETDAIGT